MKFLPPLAICPVDVEGFDQGLQEAATWTSLHDPMSPRSLVGFAVPADPAATLQTCPPLERRTPQRLSTSLLTASLRSCSSSLSTCGSEETLVSHPSSISDCSPRVSPATSLFSLPIPIPDQTYFHDPRQIEERAKLQHARAQYAVRLEDDRRLLHDKKQAKASK